MVSLGDIEDRGLILWEWQKSQEKRLFSNKLGKPVYQVSFYNGPGSEFFTTAGQEHLKFWYFEDAIKKLNILPSSQISMLESQSADLTKVKTKSFVGVQSLGIYVYGYSQDGNLYKFN